MFAHGLAASEARLDYRQLARPGARRLKFQYFKTKQDELYGDSDDQGKVSLDTDTELAKIRGFSKSFKLIRIPLDSKEAGLDMDQLDLQLQSLDKVLFDSRLKADWNSTNFIVKIPFTD